MGYESPFELPKPHSSVFLKCETAQVINIPKPNSGVLNVTSHEGNSSSEGILSFFFPLKHSTSRSFSGSRGDKKKQIPEGVHINEVLNVLSLQVTNFPQV